jgi:outer membrane protein assembly factor BamE (lipoprotein component of BamABCDE complex)
MKLSKRLLTLSLLGFTSLFLVSCATNATQRRIDKNPEMYTNLSADDKNLVNAKKIDRGMSKEAVYLAFGEPSRSSKGSKGGANYERWYYTRLSPNYTGGYYPGYGYYGPRGYYGYGAAFSAFPDYTEELRAIVEFRNNKVYGWEDAR